MFVCPSLCPTVRLSACVSAAPTRRICVKFDIEDFKKVCRETPNLVEIGQKIRGRLDENLRMCYCGGNTKSPQGRCLRLYQARIAEEV